MRRALERPQNSSSRPRDGPGSRAPECGTDNSIGSALSAPPQFMARIHKALAASLALATLFACSEPQPAATPPKAVRPVTSTTQTGTVGQPLPGGITVHVVDYSERSVEGAKVGFSIINGDGSVSSHLVVTDGDGNAHTEWTLGQTAGSNEVVASIFGVDSTPHFLATGAPATASGIAI